jgi:hypothetical protein
VEGAGNLVTTIHHLEEPLKPQCFDHLHELSETEWDVISVLRWRETEPHIPDDVRVSLAQRGLILGDSLTPEGRLAADWIDEFTTPWREGDGKIYKSCAVVASDGKGNDVLLHACGPAIDWHVDEIGNSCDDLCLTTPEPGVWIWVGSMGAVRVSSIDYGEDWDFEATGEWRAPTTEEWEFIKAGECPWDKETLPKWAPPHSGEFAFGSSDA